MVRVKRRRRKVSPCIYIAICTSWHTFTVIMLLNLQTKIWQICDVCVLSPFCINRQRPREYKYLEKVNRLTSNRKTNKAQLFWLLALYPSTWTGLQGICLIPENRFDRLAGYSPNLVSSFPGTCLYYISFTKVATFLKVSEIFFFSERLTIFCILIY